MNSAAVQRPPAARLPPDLDFPPLGANDSEISLAQAQYDANLKKAGKGEFFYLL